MVVTQRIWSFVVLFLYLSVASAGVLRPVPRLDDASETTAVATAKDTDSPSSTATGEDVSTTVSASGTETTAESTVSSTLAHSVTVSATSSVSATVTATSSANNTLFNGKSSCPGCCRSCCLTPRIATIAEGDLPLTPEITPGMSIAGVVLMLCGAAYALVGIKSRWVHCFFSIAFLAALSITVLILYVMNPPISNVLQVGYVLAALGSAALLGGVSLIFQDVLEFFACLLGGFCFSMWILTLRPGGTIGAGGASVAIFIACFSAFGTVVYFSKKTRGYYMIGCIAFSGATATVIGLDCFTRAGLKEFWAYIWNVNENLFPIDTSTYPLTRGIRVEQAAIILICLVGIMSQLRIWKVIEERRAKKNEEQRKEEAALQQEDEDAGKQTEGENARERRDWDAVYGNPKRPASIHTAYDSGVGDMDNEKKHRSFGTATSGTPRSVINEEGHIEMDNMAPKPRSAALLMGKDQAYDGVTVRVAVDEVASPTAAIDDDTYQSQNQEIGHEGDTRPIAKPSADQLRSTPGTPAPVVVPLPFKVPTPEDEDDARDDADRSSIAAIPDDYENVQERRSVETKRSSLVNRLSAGSADLFKRLSHHSISKQLQKAAERTGEGKDDLESLVPADRDSVAATFDDASLPDEDELATPSERRWSEEIKADAAKTGESPVADEKEITKEVAEVNPAERRASFATVATGSLDPAAIGTRMATDGTAEEKESTVGKTIASEVNSGPVSLTKAHLPGRMSKIAMSYRTNEWAKHLSYADVPATEELSILEPIVSVVTPVEEQAAPVDVKELQKTAANAAPPPAMPRSTSMMSMARASVAQQMPSPNPSSRRTSARMQGAIIEGNEPNESRNSEARKAAVQAAAAALVGDTVAAAPAARPLHSRPPVPGLVSYNSPQTLIGQRDLIMRVKKQSLLPDSLRGSTVPEGAGSGAADSARNQAAYGAVAALGPPRSMRDPDSLSSSRRSSGAYGSNHPGTPPNNADADLDDNLTLSQRRALIRERRNSMASINSTSGNNQHPGSSSSRRSSFGYASPTPLRTETIDSSSSSSSQLASRRADLPSQSRAQGSRDSQHQQQQQLAGYRQSVMQSMTGAMTQPGFTTGATGAAAGYGHQMTSGRNSSSSIPTAGPLIDSVYGIPGTSSNHSLLAQQQQMQAQSPQAVWNEQARLDLEARRVHLLRQKEADQQRRESRRMERARGDHRFETRMRNDNQMMDAHREAMRRMQRKAT